MMSFGNAPAELRAAALAMKRADSEVRKGVAQRMRSTMSPVWKQELTSRASGLGGRILTANARIATGNPPQLITAASKRKIGRGLIPDRHWAGFEYGANRNSYSSVTRNGTTFKRRTKRHLPQRGKGRTITPTVEEVLPRIAAYWTQSVIKSFMDAAEGKG